MRLIGSIDIAFGGLDSISTVCFENVKIMVKAGEEMVVINMLVVAEKKTLELE